MANPIHAETLADAHPTSEQLKQFVAGCLESEQLTWVEHHIADCKTCCQLLDSAPNDRLTELIRKSSIPQASSLRLVAGFQIQSELGRGGMGVVYRAIQIALRRQVALKMIAQGIHAGHQELVRFRREAEATAALRHPFIAQVYDVGEINGQPYIAMELVHGCTLSERLLKGPLRFDEATSLLIKLAQAMQHAHANGIVHRDLKPPNILLEHTGNDAIDEAELRPKIVDFGLAKCIDSSATVTSTGIIIGTPSYMSPEQAIGNNALVGPSTDIYSLGAILYEALVGRPPFKGASPIETLAQVRTAEPAKPSMLRPGLPKDLETICLKCLEKSAKDRYPSASDLLEDLHLFKDGRPILARPASLVTRAWKWTKRYPAFASLIGVTILATASLVTLGLVYNTSLRYALKVSKEEQIRADENFQFAIQAVEQMLDRVGFAQLADTPEMEGVREKLLTDAVDFYSKLLKGQPRPDIDSRRQYYGAMARLGKIQWTLGKHASAVGDLQQAIEWQRQLSNEHPDRVDLKLDLAISHTIKGTVSQDANEFRAAIDLLQPLSELNPACKRELAQATNNLATVTASIEDREQLHLSVLALRKELLLDSPDDPTLRYGLGETQHNLGFLYHTTGRTTESEQAYRAAFQIFEKLVSESDSVTDYRNALAESITHIATLVHSLGRTDEAITLIDRAIDNRKVLAARFPKLPSMREAVIRGLLTKAAFLIQNSQFASASDSSHEAVAIATGLVEELHDARYRFLEATCLTILATSLSGEPKIAEAKIAYERANVTYNELLKTDPTNVEYTIEAGVQFMNYSNVLRNEDPTQAAAFNDRSIRLLEQVFEKAPQRTDFQSYLFNAHGARAGTYEALGDHREAVVSWSRALQLAPPERRIEIGLLKALALARGGEHTLAAEACKAILNEGELGGPDLYNLACVFGLADKARRKSNDSVSSGESLEDYAESAVELLQRSPAIEFLRIPTNRQQLLQDSDLETVRNLPSFDNLLKEIDN